MHKRFGYHGLNCSVLIASGTPNLGCDGLGNSCGEIHHVGVVHFQVCVEQFPQLRFRHVVGQFLPVSDRVKSQLFHVYKHT